MRWASGQICFTLGACKRFVHPENCIERRDGSLMRLGVGRADGGLRGAGSESQRPSMPDPRAREDRTVVLAKLLSEQRLLCGTCLLAKSGFAVGDVIAALKRIAETISVERDIAGRCGACEQWTLVYSLFGKSPK